MLRMIPIEDRVGKVFAGTCQRGRKSGAIACQALDGKVEGPARGKDMEERLYLRDGGGLVQRDAERPIVEAPEIHAILFSLRRDRDRGAACWSNAQGIEEWLVSGVAAETTQSLGENDRQAMDAFRDAAKPFRAVVGSIHSGDDRQEHLSRADVAGGLVTPDVLFARLKRKPQSPLARGIFRDSNEAARQLAFIVILRCHKGGVRPAKS